MAAFSFVVVCAVFGHWKLLSFLLLLCLVLYDVALVRELVVRCDWLFSDCCYLLQTCKSCLKRSELYNNTLKISNEKVVF